MLKTKKLDFIFNISPVQLKNFSFYFLLKVVEFFKTYCYVLMCVLRYASDNKLYFRMCQVLVFIINYKFVFKRLLHIVDFNSEIWYDFIEDGIKEFTVIVG
mgnify:CR=1 FL=1